MVKSTTASISILLAFGIIQLSLASSFIPSKLERLSSIMGEINEELNLLSSERLTWGNQFDNLFELAHDYPIKLSKTFFLVHTGMYTITNYNFYNIFYEQLGLFKKYEIPKDNDL